jgi:adenosylcobinamide-GDP ribazoletransferase
MVGAASLGKPGNGMVARQVERTTGRSAGLSFVVRLVSCLILFAISALAFSEFRDAIPELITVLAVGMLVSTLVGFMMARTANRVFGMVNGDILGATNEVARPFLAFFILLAVAILLAVI